MKRKIATLDIFADDIAENSGAEEVSPGRYQIDLALNGVTSVGGFPKDVQTSLAHELGHFVAMVTGDPTHGNIAAVTRLPGEKKAWELAEKILPGKINKLQKQLGLRSYIEGGHLDPQDMIY